MKFKVIPGSESHKKLAELYLQIEAAEKIADDVVKSLGGSKYAFTGNYLNRTVDAIYFEETPDRNLWRRVGKDWQCLYAPKVKNKEVIEKLKEIPTLSNEEFNVITGYKTHGFIANGGLAFSSRMGLKKSSSGVFLLEVHENATYTPHSDIIEILESEYKTILNHELAEKD